MRLSPIVGTAASLMVVSAVAQNAPANLERPSPQASQEAPRADLRVPESQWHTWYQKLVAHLDKYRRNPHDRLHRDGEVVIGFALDRAGHIMSAKIEKSSGDPVTDDAALALMQRADPLPPPPSFGTNEQLHFVVPIRFRLERTSD
jgi:periplasmic protein TonB